MQPGEGLRGVDRRSGIELRLPSPARAADAPLATSPHRGEVEESKPRADCALLPTADLLSNTPDPPLDGAIAAVDGCKPLRLPAICAVFAQPADLCGRAAAQKSARGQWGNYAAGRRRLLPLDGRDPRVRDARRLRLPRDRHRPPQEPGQRAGEDPGRLRGLDRLLLHDRLHDRLRRRLLRHAKTIAGGAPPYDAQGYTLVRFFFLCTFAAAVPAIISGGIAERAKFGPQAAATAILVGFCYPLHRRRLLERQLRGAGLLRRSSSARPSRISPARSSCTPSAAGRRSAPC